MKCKYDHVYENNMIYCRNTGNFCIGYAYCNDFRQIEGDIKDETKNPRKLAYREYRHAKKNRS